MLTPKFSVSQDDDHVTVEVHLTGVCRLDLAEAAVEDDTLLFTCEPYFLRLHLTGPCMDSADSVRCPSFDADTGVLTLAIRKAQPGRHFPDLGMLTSLLMPPGGAPRTSVLVQELLTGEEPPSSQGDVIDQLDWFAEPGQEAATGSVAVGSGGLGFAFRRRDEQSAGLLRGLDHLLPGLVCLSHAERLAAKEAAEAAQFDPDYYLADLHEPSEQLTESLAQPVSPAPVTLDEEARQTRLMSLPRRPQLPLDELELRRALLALGDLLFAFCLDWRVCDGEQTPESARTVLTQAACLSCQCPLGSVPQLLRSCYRRALCYGLWRSWPLCRLVAKDAARLLGDKAAVLDCLLRLERLFATGGDGYSALNYLTLTDTCVWLQRCPQALLTGLAESLLAGAAAFEKEEVGLDLAEWELAASLERAELS